MSARLLYRPLKRARNFGTTMNPPVETGGYDLKPASPAKRPASAGAIGSSWEVMERTKGSSKDRWVMPKKTGERSDIRPGQEFHIINKGGVIILVPDKPVAAMRGFVRGMRTAGFREKKDRL